MQHLTDNSNVVEKYLVSTLMDIESLKALIGNEALDINDSVFKVFPQSTHHLLVQNIKVNKNLLEKHSKGVQTVISRMKYETCMGHLSKVESIPRLYRRTNRNFPQEPSSYVVSALEVLLKLNSSYPDINTSDIFLSTINIIIEQISSQ